ncbi:MAG: hypothetical protein ACR2IP_13020 [Solirubrobacteraceae bacterium]
MRTCWLAWLAGLLAAMTTPLAAAATTKHTAPTTSATTAPAQGPSSLSGSGGGSLGGGLTSPGGGPTATSATPTVISTATSTAGGGGLSGTSAIAIAVGAFVVLGGISFFIWRDARRRAPIAARSSAGGEGARQNRPGSKAPPKARKLSASERKRRKRGRAKR